MNTSGIIGPVISPEMIPLVFTVIQENTPKEFRGRVFGLYDAAIFTAMVPGRLLAGLMVEWTGLVQTLLIVSGAYAFAIAGMVLNPNLRNLSPPETVEDEAKVVEETEQPSPGTAAPATNR